MAAFLLENFMKKKLIFCLLPFFCFFAASEIISWKGMEMGMEKSPSWLTLYLKNKDETKLRKKFELDENENIFYASSESESLENARYAAEMQCRKKMLDFRRKAKNADGKVQQVSGMEQLTEYWERDSEGIYKIYVFYTMQLL